jgi:polygalacturonase
MRLCVVGLLCAVGAQAATCTVSSSTSFATAVADCCRQGGGTVVVPSGTWTSSTPVTITCSNLEIQLASGATLHAPNSQAAYGSATAFLSASGVSNIKITGKGTMDGNGAVWWVNDSTDKNPYFIRFTNINGLVVSDITMTNSPKLTLYTSQCNRVRITGVTMKNPYTSKSKNLDCIDPSGDDIYIANCNLECGDDNVAIKGGTSNVLVENCHFGTGHGASIGSVTDKTVKNVTFRGITMSGTDNGCRIKTAVGYKGGLVKDITFDTFTMDKVKNPIVIDGAYTGLAGPDNNGFVDVADIDGVTFHKIRSTNAQKSSYITCDASHPCKNIVLSDISDSVAITCTNAHGTAKTPLSPASYTTCLKA